jgi:hypothetical protein
MISRMIAELAEYVRKAKKMGRMDKPENGLP